MLSFKEKLLAAKGYDPKLTKLIFSGKILGDDAATLGDAGVKTKEDGGFIVVMVSKAKVRGGGIGGVGCKVLPPL